MEYITDDLYRAAALITETGREPDEYLRIHTNVNGKINVSMRWNDREGLPLEELERGELKVEVLKYREIFVQLKRIMFKIKDGRLDESNRDTAKRTKKEKDRSPV